METEYSSGSFTVSSTPKQRGPILSIANLTSPGTFTGDDLYNLWWGLRYQALYQYNRSPWVEHGYCPALENVILLSPGQPAPAGTWHIELLDTSDQEGALGYHEDATFDQHSEGPKKGSGRSSRGLAAQRLTPLAKVFCKTSKDDGVAPSEVASHEMVEMLADPQVVNESEIRKYLNSENKQWYIGELCDAVQGRGYDVGAPEGRSTGVVVADFVYPSWFGQVQTRPYTSFAEEARIAPRVEPFTLAPGGYMSIAPENEPSNWHQIYGSTQT